jgi:hypothetical protein
MSWLRRTIVWLFGIAVAIAAGLAVLPLAALLDPATRHAGSALAGLAIFAITRTGLDPSSAGEAMRLAQLVWAGAMAICVMPIVLTVLIGEIARVRSFLWYAGATGLLAAAAPWLLRAAFHSHKAGSASPEELSFAFVFFLTGVFSGTVFWLIAMRQGKLATILI